MRTLILKFGAIGDVIMAIPAAHQLHLQGHAIDWVVGPAALPILRLYPWINPVPIDERALLKGSPFAKIRVILRLWLTLVRRRYTLAATLYYDPRYRLLTLPIRAQRKVQLSHSDRSRRLLPGRHHTDEYARILLNYPDQFKPTPLAPVAAPPESLPQSPLPPAARSRIALAPAGAKNLMADDALRRWPPQNYVALTQLLLAQGHEVILVGGPDDAWITPHFASLPVINRIGRDTLPQTLALLNSAQALITHDTGPLHLGGIATCAVIGLFGPTDPRGRIPQRPNTTALWGGESLPCRPCYDGHSFAPCTNNACITQITPTQVLERIQSLLPPH